jgi:hypothetical protein
VHETAHRPPPAVQWSNWISALGGLWLIVAPVVLNYGDTDPHWNDVAFGALTAFLAIGRATDALRSAWVNWLIALIGAWIMGSAFWLDVTAPATMNDLVVGAVLLTAGIAGATGTMTAQRAARDASPERAARRRPRG